MANKRGRPKIDDDERYPINKHKYKPTKESLKRDRDNGLSLSLYKGYLAIYKNAFGLKEFSKTDLIKVDKEISRMLDLL